MTNSSEVLEHFNEPVWENNSLADGITRYSFIFLEINMSLIIYDTSYIIRLFDLNFAIAFQEE